MGPLIQIILPPWGTTQRVTSESFPPGKPRSNKLGGTHQVFLSDILLYPYTIFYLTNPPHNLY